MNFQPHAGRLAPRHGAQHPIAPPETVPALTWPADAVMAAADLLRGRWLAGIAITAFIAAVVAVPIVATVITVECWWHVTAPLPGNAALSALRRSCLIEALGAVAAFAMLGAPILAGLLHIATQAASTGRLGFKGWLAGFRSFRDVVVISGAAGLICCLVCVHWAFALLWPAVWFCMCLAIGERVRLRCALGDALRGAREIVSQARLMLITNGITSVVLLAGGALSAWLVCESAGRGLGAYVSLWDPRTYAGDRLIDALVWLLLSLIGLPVGLAGLRLIPMSVLTLGVAHSSAAEVASGVDACEPPPSPLFARELAAGPYFGGD